MARAVSSLQIHPIRLVVFLVAIGQDVGVEGLGGLLVGLPGIHDLVKILADMPQFLLSLIVLDRDARSEFPRPALKTIDVLSPSGEIDAIFFACPGGFPAFGTTSFGPAAFDLFGSRALRPSGSVQSIVLYLVHVRHFRLKVQSTASSSRAPLDPIPSLGVPLDDPLEHYRPGRVER